MNFIIIIKLQRRKELRIERERVRREKKKIYLTATRIQIAAKSFLRRRRMIAVMVIVAHLRSDHCALFTTTTTIYLSYTLT